MKLKINGLHKILYHTNVIIWYSKILMKMENFEIKLNQSKWIKLKNNDNKTKRKNYYNNVMRFLLID